jgi:predicted MFS family arabinose efflux permease
MLAGVGPAATAILAALLALAGLAGLSALPARAADPGDGDHRRSLPDLRLAAWPAVALAIGAVATGVTITFLPVAHPELSPALVMVALLIGNLSSACARWASGRPIDRRGPTAAVTGGVMAAVFGMLCLSRTGGVAVIAGTAIVGCAFGILQSATLAQLLGRARPSEIDGAGALWNGAYDAGFGVGGLAFGGLATRLNYGASFTVTALGLTILACLIFWRFEARDGNK